MIGRAFNRSGARVIAPRRVAAVSGLRDRLTGNVSENGTAANIV